MQWIADFITSNALFDKAGYYIAVFFQDYALKGLIVFMVAMFLYAMISQLTN